MKTAHGPPPALTLTIYHDTLCATCNNTASKEGWCRKCYPMFGNAAWSQVGKRPETGEVAR